MAGLAISAQAGSPVPRLPVLALARCAAVARLPAACTPHELGRIAGAAAAAALALLLPCCGSLLRSCCCTWCSCLYAATSRNAAGANAAAARLLAGAHLLQQAVAPAVLLAALCRTTGGRHVVSEAASRLCQHDDAGEPAQHQYCSAAPLPRHAHICTASAQNDVCLKHRHCPPVMLLTLCRHCVLQHRAADGQACRAHSPHQELQQL